MKVFGFPVRQEAGTYYIQGYDDARQGRENWAIDILNAAAKKNQSLFEYLSELSYYFASEQASREAKEVAARLALEREQLELLGERLQVEQYKLESLRVKLEALRQEAEAAGA